MAIAKKTPKIVKEFLSDLNKTDAQKQEEKACLFIETAIIDVQGSIGAITTVEIPKLKLDIRQAEVALERAKTAYTKACNTIPSDNKTQTYISGRNIALKNVDREKENLEMYKENLAKKETELAGFEVILADLQA